MIIDVYKRNKGNRHIYSEIVQIDWYDGATSGVFKLDQSDQWFLFNLCFFDPMKGERIFFMIPQTTEWVQQFVGMMEEDTHGTLVNFNMLNFKMAMAFEQYQGEVFLLNASHLEEVDYTIAEVPLTYLRFVDTIEGSMEQDEDYITQLRSFFLE